MCIATVPRSLINTWLSIAWASVYIVLVALHGTQRQDQRWSHHCDQTRHERLGTVVVLHDRWLFQANAQ